MLCGIGIEKVGRDSSGMIDLSHDCIVFLFKVIGEGVHSSVFRNKVLGGAARAPLVICVHGNTF